MADLTQQRVAYALRVEGVVQGVGFRPFVYNLAVRHGLGGWVKNTSAGVIIHVDGPPDRVQAFITALEAEAPPLAHVEAIHAREIPTEGLTSFSILKSETMPDAFQPIPPDVALCEDCRRELHDPNDRRHRYPFINCTNCGPRLTIIEGVPYDRPLTTMAAFEMCANCAREYHDPTDRRFHAQPVACPDCGPHLWLEVNGETIAERDEVYAQINEILHTGHIVAIHGLGGFHLACDATNDRTVRSLRERKFRPHKPFAVMMADLDMVRAYCAISEEEAALLTSAQAPVVVLQALPNTALSRWVTPGQTTIGVMLPTTPLHELLFEEGVPPLVMTSGNQSGEPIATTRRTAMNKLGDIADAFLLHNRPIHTRVDDSVVRVVNGVARPIRRARGYAPRPIRLPFVVPPLLATGAELKNTFALTRGDLAVLSHHIGDVSNLETLTAMEEGIHHYEALFGIEPRAVAHDNHPDYLPTQYAQTRGWRDDLATIGVQHHHAHIAACLADNGHPGDRPVIGVAFDGTGYGTDGAIWGGEFLMATYMGYGRAYYLNYVALPGADAAIRHPARFALAHLLHADIPLEGDLPPLAELSGMEQRVIQRQIETRLNAPFTSSMGRLFDAVASLIGLRHTVTYEGQAAIELEAIADPDEHDHYVFMLADPIRTEPVIHAVVRDQRAGVPREVIAARFHNGVGHLTLEVCRTLRRRTGINEVALSGGVFQNVTLHTHAEALLGAAGFRVYTHRQVPTNDGGLALGQAAIAGAMLRAEGWT